MSLDIAPTPLRLALIMSQLGPESIADVVAACQVNADEICRSLARALDAQCSLSVGQGASFDACAQLAGFEGPGLALMLRSGQTAMVAVLPESSGLLPDWYREPGPTGVSRLATWAQELGMLVVPETIHVEHTSFLRLDSIARSLLSAEPHAAAARVPLTLELADQSHAILHLVWPLLAVEKLSQPMPESVAPTAISAAVHAEIGEALPAYVRSLLRVKMPVSVSLASRKKSVDDILELGIGSIIHFDKPCDDPLDLEVNGHAIAQGEAVKVGDKFGLRVQSVLLPQERFHPLKPAGNT